MTKQRKDCPQNSLIFLDWHNPAQILKRIIYGLHPFALSGISPLDHLRRFAVRVGFFALFLLLAGHVVVGCRAETYAGAVAALQAFQATVAACAAVSTTVDNGLLAAVRIR